MQSAVEQQHCQLIEAIADSLLYGWTAADDVFSISVTMTLEVINHTMKNAPLVLCSMLIMGFGKFLPSAV